MPVQRGHPQSMKIFHRKCFPDHKVEPAIVFEAFAFILSLKIVVSKLNSRGSILKQNMISKTPAAAICTNSLYEHPPLRPDLQNRIWKGPGNCVNRVSQFPGWGCLGTSWPGLLIRSTLQYGADPSSGRRRRQLVPLYGAAVGGGRDMRCWPDLCWPDQCWPDLCWPDLCWLDK